MRYGEILHKITQNRNQQIRKGYTVKHDLKHDDGSVLLLAKNLLNNIVCSDKDGWTEEESKHISDKYNEIDKLIIISSLIIAEIERRTIEDNKIEDKQRPDDWQWEDEYDDY